MRETSPILNEIEQEYLPGFEVLFPGAKVLPDNAPELDLFFARIARATIILAIKDAVTKKDNQVTLEARAWLLSEGGNWCDLCGMPINAEDITELAANGWQPA